MSSDAGLYERMRVDGLRIVAPSTWIARAADRAGNAMRSFDLMNVWTLGIRLVLSMLILTVLTALGVILLVLGAMRIVAVRCSPTTGDSIYETF
jgi:hypothetical protein